MDIDSNKKTWRLSHIARKLNVGTGSIVAFLETQGYSITQDPNTKIDNEQFIALKREFATSALDKEEASLLDIGLSSAENVVIHTEEHSRGARKVEENIRIKNLTSTQDISAETGGKESSKEATDKIKSTIRVSDTILHKPKVVGKIAIGKASQESAAVEATSTSAAPSEHASKSRASSVEEKKPAEVEVLRAQKTFLRGPVVVDKIELRDIPTEGEKKKRLRKRISTAVSSTVAASESAQAKKASEKESFSAKEINENIKATLAKLSHSTAVAPTKSKLRKEKRSAQSEKEERSSKQVTKVLQTTEFVSVNDLSVLMDVSVNDLIVTCMQMGMLVSINQRLDSETIVVLADEYGYEVQFSAPEEEKLIVDEQEDLLDDATRAPIVTIMGHVDHGKTSLLDFIRDTKVAAAEAGGITQHIGAYEVLTKERRKVVFLDTPGHAAFTAMRARGARLTDLAVIVVAADDSVMPQTEEAINHVKVAAVPFLVAINKIDKEGANPEKIREQLSKLNVLVEEWGGKIQSQEISAKTGQGVDQLLEKLLLEADILELKANAKRRATGSVIEATLEKGRGYVANLLVQNGTLSVSNVLLAGLYVGKVKAMFDHLGKRIKQVGPSTPVQILGLDGPPQAGDKFITVEYERDGKEIANKRQQIARQQSIRTKKHMTLDEIGRRLALNSFKELNLLIKGDVDGSIEALSDSLLKLSTEEVQVNVIHKAVGQISESDVHLATASDAIIVGFQVRPSENAKAIAEKEQIEIRLYSVIFDAINEIKDAIKGMHAPKVEEVITATLEIRQLFKLPKVGAVAGCMLKEGTLKREHDLRVIRDGIVVHQGELAHLKRFKEDVSEVKQGYECGVSLKNYSDIQIGDHIEGFTKQEVRS